MAFAEKESDGTTNNTTAVTMVAAPSSGVRRIITWLSVHNADSASATVTIRYNNNGTTRIISKTVLAVGDNLQLSAGDKIVLAATTSTLEIVLGGSVSTTQLPYTAHYADAS